MQVNQNINAIKTDDHRRLNSIDYYKGICIFWICASHLCESFLLAESIWFWRFLFLGMEFMGSASFLFCMGLTLTYSIRSKSTEITATVMLSTLRKRVIPLWIIASVVQFSLWFFYQEEILNPLYPVFRWDILQTLAFAPIIVVLSLRFSKITRVILSLIGLIASNSIYSYLTSYNNLISQILIILFFYPMTLTALIPMVFFGIIASVCMEYIMIYRESKTQLKRLFSRFIQIGGLLILISIIASPFDKNTSFLIDQTDILHDLSFNSKLSFIETIPTVLVVNSVSNCFLRLGIVLILYTVVFYLLDYRSIINPNTRMNQYILFWGRYSLSYFVYLSVFALIPFQCNEYSVFVLTTACLLTLTGILYVLIHRHHGIGTIEWVLSILANSKKTHA